MGISLAASDPSDIFTKVSHCSIKNRTGTISPPNTLYPAHISTYIPNLLHPFFRLIPDLIRDLRETCTHTLSHHTHSPGA